MTLVTLSNLNAEDFSFHNIAINRTWQLVGTEMTEASWGKNLVFEDPGGRKLRGESKFSPTTPLNTMLYLIIFWINLQST